MKTVETVLGAILAAPFWQHCDAGPCFRYRSPPAYLPFGYGERPARLFNLIKGKALSVYFERPPGFAEKDLIFIESMILIIFFCIFYFR